MRINFISTFYLLFCTIAIISCKNTSSSFKSIDELQNYVIEIIEQDKNDFIKLYPALNEYADSLASYVNYDGPEHLIRVGAQKKSRAISSFLISKYAEFGNHDNYENLVEKYQTIQNSWVYVTSEEEPFYMHEHLYTSYKETDDEIEDYFTFFVYPKTKVVAIVMPLSAAGSPTTFFAKSFSEDMSDYSYYSFENIYEYDDPGEIVSGLKRIVAVGDVEVFDYVLQNSTMIIYFYSNRPESDGYSGVEKAYVNLSGLHKMIK